MEDLDAYASNPRVFVTSGLNGVKNASKMKKCVDFVAPLNQRFKGRKRTSGFREEAPCTGR
jgi:hypothetical protein